MRALEALARRWVPGTGPIEIHRLTAGLVNQSLRVVRDGNAYALRTAAADSREAGVDRAWECRVLEAADLAGLAPCIERCNATAGILVTRWVNGRAWSMEEVCRRETIDSMAQLLRRVHAIPIPIPPRIVTPAEWVADYTAATRDAGVAVPCESLRAAAAQRLDWLAARRASEALGRERPAARTVLCHGDLHRFNVLIAAPSVLLGEALVLIDWEYAHVSDAFWDLAGWIANNDLPVGPAQRLLSSYLHRPADAGEWAALQNLTWLYDYVCLLWSVLHAARRTDSTRDEVAARAAQLQLRLSGAES